MGSRRLAGSLLELGSILFFKKGTHSYLDERLLKQPFSAVGCDLIMPVDALIGKL